MVEQEPSSLQRSQQEPPAEEADLWELGEARSNGVFCLFLQQGFPRHSVILP